ncbi:SDR family NAD(P)-dependent oxidoreductase [Lentzea aerocolonigenes]|uniref:SDR family NAD(P)-dependent oxidoreductase n=1 Tax=Lentzea aerocolonigenes TaxID=68170 RepID=UPI00056264C4|nr:SDR family NAD(P)-dependent oxidoreductase [Lentzea aerocolonigenes]MCP2242852.1 NADP-dependent 3-hydroxy acid dehydrogenase YdfG [Lentzea aerocolonigenes]
MTTRWNVHRLPRAEGKTFLVTGANAGIGYHVAEQLAGTGATIVLGSRNAEKADAAMASIRSVVPGARVRHLQLDLADLDSVKAAAHELDSLDAVVCNGGVMIDDAELMYATNHLGHFALVGWLMPLLAGGRVVTTGSLRGKKVKAGDDYARSKQAQMLFGFELDRRQGAVTSIVNHPGGALDSITFPASLLLQGKDAGAWPAVRAVLDPDVRGGEMVGPRVFGLRGEPQLEPVRSQLADEALAARVWEESVELTGVEPV